MVRGTGFTEKGKGLDDLKNSLKSLGDSQVLIGIPESENARDDDSGITNSQLAFIHSQGSPLQGIPPRPFLEPSIDRNKDLLAIQQKNIINKSLSGDGDGYREEMEKTGLLMSTKAKEFLTDPANGLAPNSPGTIRRKGSSKPLIDTGSLLNSITYVVRERGQND